MGFCRKSEYIDGIDIPIIDIGLPIGISFYTFKSISYIVDTEESKAEKSPFEFLLYVSLFHHLVAGPIVRIKMLRKA